MPPQLQCPICDQRHPKKLFDIAEGQLLKCKNCTLAFYSPVPSLSDLLDFYNAENYRETYHEGSLAGIKVADIRYQQICRYLYRQTPDLLRPDRQSQYLDIGCGEGDLMKVFAAQGWEVTGTEISPEAARRAGDDWQNHIKIGDIDSLDFAKGSFDLITMYHILEHLINPVRALTKIAGWLKPGGVLFIETPNWGGLGARLKGRDWALIIPPEHLTYFNSRSLIHLLRRTEYSQIKTYSSAPQLIQSLARLPVLLRMLGWSVYQLSAHVGLGANLQALAFAPVADDQ
ncbi:MAG: class I SAM-dependent methyltransferase [Leptolyngbya sp. RL_3_1]|nr:class I SAM-dependent methyltransferase [Leptolyngbya sp. RL_3_1]